MHGQAQRSENGGRVKRREKFLLGGSWFIEESGDEK